MTKEIGRTIEPEAEFDEYCNSYSEEIAQSLAFSGQQHDFFTKVKAEYLTDIFRHEGYVDSKVNVLDVGCGHGLIHDYLLAGNAHINLFGVDVASSVIDIAKVKNPSVTYQSYEGRELPFSECSFDIAFAICVMHHVPPQRWTLFLQEMKRVVKENGIVVIFEHNPINPVTARIVKKCPLDKNAVLLRSKKMVNLMKEVGLNKITTNYILFTPFDNAFFQKMDRKLSWLPLGAQYFTLARKNI